MPTYIAMLRGINVSGQKMIKMDALRQMFDNMGFADAKTYIQSGNVVFKTKKTTNATLEKKIHDQIEKTFGFDVPVIIRDTAEMNKVIETNPYLQKGEDLARLYITFLDSEPNADQLQKIQDLSFPPDKFELIGKEIYLCVYNGYGNSKLSNNLFEAKLKLKATTRNWKTVNELVRMCKE